MDDEIDDMVMPIKNDCPCDYSPEVHRGFEIRHYRAKNGVYYPYHAHWCDFKGDYEHYMWYKEISRELHDLWLEGGCSSRYE